MIRPFFSLLLASLALAATVKQAVLNDDGSVRISESWSYEDCGQPLVLDSLSLH